MIIIIKIIIIIIIIIVEIINLWYVKNENITVCQIFFYDFLILVYCTYITWPYQFKLRSYPLW